MKCRLPSPSGSFSTGERFFSKLTPAALLILGLLQFASLAALGQSPTVTVNGPTQITDSSAIISVNINPNGLSTAFWVQWGLTAAYGQTGPTSPIPFPGGATNVSAWMIGLSPSTTYHYRLAAANSAGTNYSADQTLTTTASPPPPTAEAPAVVTDAAQAITATNATLAGTVDPKSLPTTYYFQWGTTVAYGNTTLPATLTPNGTIGAVQVFGGLEGLSPGTTYHYQLVATNNAGPGLGDDRSFTTLSIASAEGDFTYAINNGTITIINYTGPGGAVTIPGTINGLPVTTIGERAFMNCANLTGITLPETLTSLGDWAFFGCTNLTCLALPNSLTNIQDASYVSIGGPFGVFSWCTSLTNVTFGKNLAYLGTGAFTFCTSLTAVFFQGNAPATAGTNGGPIPGPWIFLNAPLVTVYYLPGTAGWEPTFSQRPTKLWNPEVQTSDASFGVQQSRFGFNITGTPDIPIVIEASTNPFADSWSPLSTCTLTNGGIYFADPRWTTNSNCFYRIRWP